MTIDSLVSKEKSSSAHCLCCGDPISSNVRVCPDCGAPSHGDCWDYIGGCGVMGCSARGTNLDSKVLGQYGSLVVVGDVSLPEAPKPMRNYERWIAKLKFWKRREDKDSWIDSYLDKVRSSLAGFLFTGLSGYVKPGEVIGLVEGQDAILVSAQECAFHSVLTNGQYEDSRKYIRTFCFGFRDGKKSLVAYAEVPHGEWLYLMKNREAALPIGDSVVSSALARAVDEGRVVPAKDAQWNRYSCVPGEDRSSEFDRDAHNLAIFQSAAQPWGLLRYRKGLKANYYPIPPCEIRGLPAGQVIPRPLWLGGYVIIDVVNAGGVGGGCVLGVMSSQKSGGVSK